MQHDLFNHIPISIHLTYYNFSPQGKKILIPGDTAHQVLSTLYIRYLI